MVAWATDLGDLNRETLNTKPANQEMPIWSAANAVLSEEEMQLKRVALLPVLPHPVTWYALVYTPLKNLQGMLRYLVQTTLQVTCGEDVYHVAREIQLICPDDFKNIVLCMGSFHMTKVQGVPPQKLTSHFLITFDVVH